MEKSTHETFLLMENNKQHIISVKNVSIGYKNNMLLKDISFELQKNTIVAVLGLNGTGKSSLLRTLAGLQSPLRGEISIENKLLKQYPITELSKLLGIVLPGRGDVVPSLTVNEIFSMARSPYTGFIHALQERDKMIIQEVIKNFNIQHLLSRPIYQLSDGEMQKVMIAKTLIQETPIILLDEPTSHLDIINKIEIFSLIKQLKAKNKTILFASHELELALQVADVCILINHAGEFVFGDTIQLIADKQFEYFFNAPQFTFNPQLRKFETHLN